MKTPDGRVFTREEALIRIRAGIGAAVGWVWAGFVLLLRGIGKLSITIWRIAAALDSALWRATKLLARRFLRGLDYILHLIGIAIGNLLRWLPTPTGRAYSAIFGVMLIIAGLWVVDVLRFGAIVTPGDGAIIRAPVDEEDPILARIEGRYVHLSEIEAAARAGGFLRAGETLTPESAFERELVESYVEQRLLASAARDEGMHRSPAVTRRVNAARDRVLASAFMESKINDAVSADTIERLYRAQSDVTRLGDEVRARHILVATEAEALEIVGLLENGGEFGALARERSLDRATAPLGGEVGWFTRAMMTPTFSRAAFSTPSGSLAAPFSTEFGWHVLEVTGRRPTSSVPLSEVRDGIEEFLRMRTIDATLEDLATDAQVVYFRPADNREGIPQSMAPPIIDEVVEPVDRPEETLR